MLFCNYMSSALWQLYSKCIMDVMINVLHLFMHLVAMFLLQLYFKCMRTLRLLVCICLRTWLQCCFCNYISSAWGRLDYWSAFVYALGCNVVFAIIFQVHYGRYDYCSVVFYALGCNVLLQLYFKCILDVRITGLRLVMHLVAMLFDEYITYLVCNLEQQRKKKNRATMLESRPQLPPEKKIISQTPTHLPKH